ncbi:MAG: GspH/FimT family pseudopilin [Pontibacterium sp.]
MHRFATCQRGFTLVELVAVLVLLGILSAVAFSRMSRTDVYQDRIFQDSLQTSLRLAQRTALSQHASVVEWQLSHTGTALWHYAIRLDGSEQLGNDLESTLPVAYSVTLSDSSVLSGSLSTGQALTLRFDRLGNFTQAGTGTPGSIRSSLQLTMTGRLLCVSPTGYAYEGSCR